MIAFIQQMYQTSAKVPQEELVVAEVRRRKRGNPNGAAALRRAAKGNAAAIAANKDKADKFATGLKSIVEAIRAAGITSLNGIAKELNERHIPTARARSWQAISVRNLLTRMEGENQCCDKLADDHVLSLGEERPAPR